MLDQRHYQAYLDALLVGDRTRAHSLAMTLIDQDIAPRDFYQHLIATSMHEIGWLWETNRISVATEHIATAITESIIAEAFPRFLRDDRPDRGRILIACTPSEYHQVGARIVADLFEIHGWTTRLIGGTTPLPAVLDAITEFDPHRVGISVSVSFNITTMRRLLHGIRERFPDVPVLIGGQAVQRVATIAGDDPLVDVVTSMDRLIDIMEQP